MNARAVAFTVHLGKANGWVALMAMSGRDVQISRCLSLCRCRGVARPSMSCSRLAGARSLALPRAHTHSPTRSPTIHTRVRARAHTYATDHGPHSSGQATRKRLDRCHFSGAHQSCAYLVVRSHARRPAGMHRRAGRSASIYALARCPMRAPAHVAIASNRHRRHEHTLRSHAAADVAAAGATVLPPPASLSGDRPPFAPRFRT